MSEFIKKEGTHVVFKETDILEHLTKAEAAILALLYEKIQIARSSLGKKENKYYVVNQDEQYSNEIFEAIKQGELWKPKEMPYCIEDKIVYRLNGLCDYRAMYLVTMQFGCAEVDEIQSDELVKNQEKPNLFSDGR